MCLVYSFYLGAVNMCLVTASVYELNMHLTYNFRLRPLHDYALASAVCCLPATLPILQARLASSLSTLLLASPSLPHPPPPGVWMMILSPGCMLAVFFAPRLMNRYSTC